MDLRLEKRRVRTDKWYSVGYSPVLEKYVMCVAAGWLAVYDRYYAVAEGEYLLSFTEPEKLDTLADSLYKAVNKSERFICSERAAENTPAQNDLCEELLKDKNDYYKKYPEMMREFERF